MATYLYETIPSEPGKKPRQYEIQQSMKDEPLTRHPETGEPIKRIITGGYGVMGSAAAQGGGGNCGCGPSGCCG